MRDSRGNSVIIMSDNKVQGILTYDSFPLDSLFLLSCFLDLLILKVDFIVHSSRDMLMRIVAQNLSPEITLAEKVFKSELDEEYAYMFISVNKQLEDYLLCPLVGWL